MNTLLVDFQEKLNYKNSDVLIRSGLADQISPKLRGAYMVNLSSPRMFWVLEYALRNFSAS